MREEGRTYGPVDGHADLGCEVGVERVYVLRVLSAASEE
jgi:hypothetical protein